MMRNNDKKVLGIILIVIGIVFLLNRLGVITANIFFAGWWTLLLLIPAVISMTRQGITFGNGILLVVGVYFLLEANGWNLKGFFVPAMIVVFGIALLLKKQ
jgi:uncharacterized membrane protein